MSMTAPARSGHSTEGRGVLMESAPAGAAVALVFSRSRSAA